MTCLPRLPVCRQTLLATAVALLLTACGGGGGSDTAPSSGAQGARPGGQNGLQPAVNPLRPGTGDASATPAGSTDASGHQADVWARYDNGEALSGFGTGDRGAGASGLLASDESPDGNPSDQSGTLRRDAAASMGAGSSVAASLTSNNPAGNDRSDVQKAVSSGGIAYPDWTLGSRREASRFLAQASFGPSPSDITTLTGSTANAWIEQQFGKGGTSLGSVTEDAFLHVLSFDSAGALVAWRAVILHPDASVTVGAWRPVAGISPGQEKVTTASTPDPSASVNPEQTPAEVPGEVPAESEEGAEPQDQADLSDG